MLASSPFKLDLTDSPIDMYLMLTNAHDGSGAVTAAVAPVRVVCMNTLRAALSGAQATYKIRHTSGAASQLTQAQRVLGLASSAAERMAAERISDAGFRAFLKRLAPDPPDSRPGRTRAENVRTDIARIYSSRQYGQENVRGTMWGAWQAVIAYTTTP